MIEKDHVYIIVMVEVETFNASKLFHLILAREMANVNILAAQWSYRPSTPLKILTFSSFINKNWKVEQNYLLLLMCMKKNIKPQVTVQKFDFKILNLSHHISHKECAEKETYSCQFEIAIR